MTITVEPSDPWWQQALRWAGGLWMWVVASPLALLAIACLAAGEGTKALIAGASYAAIALAGYSVGKRRPRTASLLLGVGVGLPAFLLTGHSPLTTLLLTGCAMAGGWLLWGEGPLVPKAPPPPLPAPYVPPPDPVIGKARNDLARVEACMRRVGADVSMRLYGIVSETRGILKEAEKDPVDLARARRLLVVHVSGLANIAERAAEGSAPANFIPLLDELHTAATQLRRQLHDADRESVEIQVEVLSRRLKEEGLV